MSGMTPARTDPSDTGPGAFTTEQKAAWAGFLRVHGAVTRALSAALEKNNGLTINEFELLLALSSSENLRLTELARQVYLSSSGITGLIERLSRRGLVRRCTHPDDARAGCLRLTDAGRAVFDTASAAHVHRVQQLFLSRFNTTEQELLGELWARFPDEPLTEGPPGPATSSSSPRS